METYNGWKNKSTWNVALWLGNDEPLYRLARGFKDYDELVAGLRRRGIEKTPDGIRFDSPHVDRDEMNDFLNNR